MLKKYQVWYFFPAANGMGRAGIPDIIAIVDGGFVGVEVKANKTKKPTALQIRCGKAIQAAGGRWFLVFDKASSDELEQYIQDRVVQHAGDRSGQGSGAQVEQSKPGVGFHTHR
jgi:hypothetical protein